MRVVESEEFLPDEVYTQVSRGLQQHAEEITGVKSHSYGFAVYEANDNLVGAIAGETFGPTLQIFDLWIAPGHRKKGIGKQLVSKSEELAQKRGCTEVVVDTMVYSAPEYYPKLGYTEIGRIKSFRGPHDRICFRKHL